MSAEHGGGCSLPGTVFLTGKARHPEWPGAARRLAGLLEVRGCRPLVDASLAPVEGVPRGDLSEAAEDLALVVVLGGDGTILGTVRRLGDRRVPLLGVNLGGLGFLAETTLDEAEKVLGEVLAGESAVEERMMLDCRALRDGRLLGEQAVLNDAVVNKGALARLIGLEARIGEAWLTRYRGDGLIVSTPTGSTAYSMAAGGPIVNPAMEAILLTPICAHSLANRPIVVPPGETVVLELTAGEDVTLTLDGQVGIPLEPGDRIEARRSPRTTLLVHSRRHDYYQVLRRKLKWGEW